jgi:hypothetical protein
LHCKSFYIALVFFFILTACNIFKTREAENPVSENQTKPGANSPQELLSNLETSFDQKNIQEYQKLFTDTILSTSSFQFVPTQPAFARYSAVFTEWNKQSEADWFRNAMSEVGTSASPKFLLRKDAQLIRPQLDLAIYTIDYDLYVPHNRANSPRQFVGRSELYLSSNKNNIWTIYRWIDYEVKKDSSWSDLKGIFTK